MKYAVEMGSGVMLYIPSSIKIDSCIQKLMEMDSQTHKQHRNLKSPLLFFQNKKVGYKYLIAQSPRPQRTTRGIRTCWTTPQLKRLVASFPQRRRITLCQICCGQCNTRHALLRVLQFAI
jgi:hypothetical protein